MMKHFPEEQIKTLYAVLPVHRIGFAYEDESLWSWDLTTFYLQIFILPRRERRRWEHDRYWPLAWERAGWDLMLEKDKTKTFLLCQSKRASNLKLFAEWSHELARWKRDSTPWYMEKQVHHVLSSLWDILGKFSHVLERVEERKSRGEPASQWGYGVWFVKCLAKLFSFKENIWLLRQAVLDNYFLNVLVIFQYFTIVFFLWSAAALILPEQRHNCFS